MNIPPVRKPTRRLRPRRPSGRGPGILLAGLLLMYATLAPPAALALRFDLPDHEITGAFDTRITVGTIARMEDQDPQLIGIANGGTSNSVNFDDGNLNYDEGDFVFATGSVTHELQLGWRNLSLFGRVFYFYDPIIMDSSTERTRLSKAAETRVGRDFRLLDLYVTGDFDIRDRLVTIRAGQQFINWGESTFIPNGINGFNDIDITRLRVAGAELRNAFLPAPAIDVNVQLTKRFSVESFYQITWQYPGLGSDTELEPAGTFFSTNDFISPGGTFAVVAGGGTLPDNPPVAGTFVSRGPDNRAREAGQFGIALRYFEPALRDTEFGLYYVHYHQGVPLVSATRAITTGLPPTASYFADYPDDIDLLGLSFNSEIPYEANTLAIQGEVSYRFDQPLQIDDQEILVAGLNLCGVGGRSSQLDSNGAAPLCGFAPGEKIKGFRRKEVLQAQTTATFLKGATFGADQLVIVGEAGMTWIPNMESKSELRYEGPGTANSGDAGTAAASGTPVQREGFADSFSMGYRLVGRLVFNSVFGLVNIAPQVAWAHDVLGTTPFPLGNFVEDRQTVTMSVRTTYLESWDLDIAYTNFFGAGAFNLRNDRDFLSASLSYYF